MVLLASTTVQDRGVDLSAPFLAPPYVHGDISMSSEKVYIQRCNSSNSSSSTSENKQEKAKPVAKFQDLNFPLASNEPLNLFDEAGLDLKLVPSSTSSPSSSNYQSVCTLDKVKSALERAEKETFRKRSISMSKSS
ncbi:unnamed protein product [Fraxinus pennsylvanica]|uniref:Uncharacterized protein n=1 Tax=Fraxinus pennsylvanica TaxID=56036 RepID=A0AAD1YXL4_9LAMI|nr:unnamed protein product [Fraxinus pennsylvanica]